MRTVDLNDNWQVNGTDYAEFQDALQKLTESTYIAKIDTSDLTLMHYTGVNADETKMSFSVHSKRQITEKRRLMTSLPIQTVLDNGADERFIKEISAESLLMMKLNDLGCQREDIYFTSRNLMRDLGARANLLGEAIYDPTDERDTYLMSRYVKHPSEAYAIIRFNKTENSTIHKIFALPSMTYCPISQTALLTIIKSLSDELGNIDCRRWHIDHNLTRIYVTFPEAAEDMCKTYNLPNKFVPGVMLETSDTGDCSLRAIAYWESLASVHHPHFGSANIGYYEQVHRGNINIADIVNGIADKIMPQYIAFPKRMAELLTIDIPDAEAGIEATMKTAGIEKAIGKKRTRMLLEAILRNNEGLENMTAYDMVMLFMEASHDYINDKDYKEKFDNAVGRMIFLDFNKIVAAASVTFLKTAM